MGPIFHPVPTLVAAVPIDLAGIDFRLRRCDLCAFQFKDPEIPPEKLLDCYARASDDEAAQEPDAHVRRFDAIADLLRRHTRGRRVMDIGCFNGALLDYLGADWEKFGIEPSINASSIARKRGVNILAPTIDALADPLPQFDAITLIDVAEHIVEPLPFFRRLRDCLSPGGILLVVTGDTDAMSWRMQRGRYWYVSPPGHVSFYSRQVMGWIGERLGMRVLESRRLSHHRSTMGPILLELIKNLGYTAVVSVNGLGIPALHRRVVGRRAPGWLTAPDHLFCVLQRVPSDAPTEGGPPDPQPSALIS